MKLTFLAACVLLLVSSPLSANSPDSKGKAKITKNEAEHLALKRFPGARVTSARLDTVQGKLVWSLQLVEESAKPPRQVAIDAMTGRISSPAGEKP